ncbi:hypothetical protein OUZ56_018694 [Daphnia magna]|uniref:Uncharacterized protein n=1 Tax=Daphnia magna TaxID=35525 RepID=A0ABQ9Z9J0_9CRUS|nr:hypothetical protein OUZ56_018694 [Daphnia magna]
MSAASIESSASPRQHRHLGLVAIHAEDRIADDADLAIPLAGIDQRSIDSRNVAMRRTHVAGARKPRAVDQAGVVQLVADQRVVAAKQGPQASRDSPPSRWRTAAPVRGRSNRPAPLRASRARRCSRRSMPPAAAGADPGQRGTTGLSHPRIAGQAEIIIAAEADAGLAADGQPHTVAASSMTRAPVKIGSAQLLQLAVQAGIEQRTAVDRRHPRAAAFIRRNRTSGHRRLPLRRGGGGRDGPCHRPAAGCSCRAWSAARDHGVLRVGGGQQALAVEDRIGASEEAQRLGFVAHLGAAGRQPHVALRHQDASHGDGAHEIQRIERRRIGQRRALDRDQFVDRHRFRMLRQIGQRAQEFDPVGLRLAHADDAAAADLDAGVADVGQRFQAVLVGTGRDDLAVELRRGVEIVVVVIEAGRLQGLGLPRFEHAEGDAGFQPQRLHLADHLRHLLDVLVLRRTPGRAHAEAGRAVGAGILGGLNDLGERHQLLGLQAGAEAGALRAVRAIFRAGARLDRQQGGQLHGVRIEMRAMNRLRPEQQVVERQREQRFDFSAGPVIANGPANRSGRAAGRLGERHGGIGR